MTLLKRVLAEVRSARPGATGQAVVTVTIKENNLSREKTMTFQGTVEEVLEAQRVYFLKVSGAGQALR